MSLPTADIEKDPIRSPSQGCDIPEPASLAQVIDALKARSKAKWSSWAFGFRRWGSASWGRAWLLGVGLALVLAVGIFACWAFLSLLGSIAFSLAGKNSWGRLSECVVGLGALGLGIFVARTLMWIAFEAPIRFWSRFSLGIAGPAQAKPGPHCFAPWTNASGIPLVIALPCVLFFMVAINFSSFSQLTDSANNNNNPQTTPASTTSSAQSARMREMAKKQVDLMALGEMSGLSESNATGASRDAFWLEAVDAWSRAMDGLLTEENELSAPSQALRKNPASIAKQKQRLVDIEQAKIRLINGYWSTLGLEKEAPRLASLSLAGAREEKSEPNVATQPGLVFCLPVPGPALNQWAIKRGALSDSARRAMASYFTATRYFDDIPRTCQDHDNNGKALVALGVYLESDHYNGPSAERPGSFETTYYHVMSDQAQRWGKDATR